MGLFSSVKSWHKCHFLGEAALPACLRWCPYPRHSLYLITCFTSLIIPTTICNHLICGLVLLTGGSAPSGQRLGLCYSQLRPQHLGPCLAHSRCQMHIQINKGVEVLLKFLSSAERGMLGLAGPPHNLDLEAQRPVSDALLITLPGSPRRSWPL